MPVEMDYKAGSEETRKRGRAVGEAGTGGGRWERGVAIARDLGEYAKLIALVLAISGLIGIYFPGVRRAWEQWVAPTSWYWIGTVRRNGQFIPQAYEHPLWNNWQRRPVARGDLLGVDGQIMITGKGSQTTDEIHIGRAEPTGRSAVRFVHDARICLEITEVDMSRGNPRTGETFVWAQARKVSC
jgi:hypothetical protein